VESEAVAGECRGRVKCVVWRMGSLVCAKFERWAQDDLGDRECSDLVRRCGEDRERPLELHPRSGVVELEESALESLGPGNILIGIGVADKMS